MRGAMPRCQAGLTRECDGGDGTRDLAEAEQVNAVRDAAPEPSGDDAVAAEEVQFLFSTPGSATNAAGAMAADTSTG